MSDAYLSNLLRNYKEAFHLVTLNTPVRRSLFGYAIDEDKKTKF